MESSAQRDKLALQRTQLANERTILAYIRTSLSFIGFGVLILKLFPELTYYVLAVISILLGVLVMILGVISYRKHKNKVAED